MLKINLKDSALLVFIVTISAYALNMVYELARLTSYEVSIDFLQIKPQNFLLTGLFIGMTLFVISTVKQIFFQYIDNHVKGKLAVIYTKEKALQLITFIVFTFIFLIAVNIPIGEDDLVSQLILKWGWLLGVVGVMATLLTFGWYIFQARNKRQTYSKYIQQRIKSNKDKFILNKPAPTHFVHAVSALLCFILVIVVGVNTAATTKKMYIIETKNDNRRKEVIIGIYNDFYITKTYDLKIKRYLEGFTLVEIEGKKVQFIKEL